MRSVTTKTLRIALSKGTLFDGAIEFLSSKGMQLGDLGENKRKLIIPASGLDLSESNYESIEILKVRGHDVPVYVEHGAADIGVVGSDVVLDSGAEVIQLRDLAYGACKLCVCALKGKYKSIYELPNYCKVATTFPNLTKEFFQRKGIDIEVLPLYGSVELGPLTDLSDAIVDLVASGKTLKENGLEAIETMMDCSSRLIANKASYKLNHKFFDSLSK